MKFSVSLDAALRNSGLTTEQKIRKAAEIGYPAFEFWAWWNEDLDKVKSVAEERRIEVASVCTKFVSLTDPSCRKDYIAGLKESIAAANKLGCRYLISQTGGVLAGVSRLRQALSVVAGLKEAAPILEDSGITLVVEPLNTRVDHPGYFLETTDDGVDMIQAVDSPNVKLLFDVYHQQITEGNLIPNITRYIGQIAYFHIADHPGRHEIGTGEINYANVLRAMEGAGYDGFVGLEYFPVGDGEQALRQFIRQFG